MCSYSVVYMGPATTDPAAKTALMNKIIMQRLAQGFQLCNKPPTCALRAGLLCLCFSNFPHKQQKKKSARAPAG